MNANANIEMLVFVILFIFSIFLLVYIGLSLHKTYYISNRLIENINPKGRGSRHIPKKIYQLVRNKNDMNPMFTKNIEYIKNLNRGWEHILYDDKDMVEYMNLYYPPYILTIYNSINSDYGAAKADFFRYLLMYREGGVYLDIKSAMKYPLDHFLKENDEYILCHWSCPFQKSKVNVKYGELQQWHIICRPGHPYLKKVIDNVINNIVTYNKDVDGVGQDGVLKVTGPIEYTRSIIPIMDDYNHTLYEFDSLIGLVYNNTSFLSLPHTGIFSHKKLYAKKHYSVLNSPIINEF